MKRTSKQKLKDLLRELFQLNHTDLDFGIYRILNIRGDDVEHFINEELDKKLEEVKSKITQRRYGEVQEEKQNLVKELQEAYGERFEDKYEQLKDIPAFKEKYEKYKQKEEELKKADETEEMEADIYNDIYRFFERYYDEGDFISKPRAGDNVYMIPYNGEEVKLYWANHDQYYIKTGENFQNYIFHNNAQHEENRVKVEFRLKEAEATVNNNQDFKKRIFVPTEDYFHWDAENQKLEIYFYYKEPSEQEIEDWEVNQNKKTADKGVVDSLLKALESKIPETKHTELIRLWQSKRKKTNKEVSTFRYHLERFTSVNKFDYFIHKNLKKFLNQELDYYLKNEIMGIKFLDPNWEEQEAERAIQKNLLKASAIREIASTTINFLHELEEFQRKLFEKKKFVVQSDYCLTLDLIPDNIFDDIAEEIIDDPNQEQIQEWRKLSLLGSSQKIDESLLRQNKSLMLDTKFLSAKLKYDLLNNISDLDSIKNGIILDTENFQALNLLYRKFAGSIDFIYIDPPYNTNATPISYKNNYKNSSWLSLMYNRLNNGIRLLKNDGVASIAIDDAELDNLSKLLSDYYYNFELQKVIVNHYPGSGTGRTNITRTHEYNLFLIPEGLDKLRGKAEGNQTRERNFRRSGTGENNYRYGRPNSFYALIVAPETKEIVDVYPPPDINETYETENTPEGNLIIYPIGTDGSERVWSLSYENVWKYIKKGLIYCTDQLSIKRVYEDELGRRNLLQSIWSSKKFSATTYGTSVIKNLFNDSNAFPYPKSIYTVETAIDACTYDNTNSITLDFFAGSGTTAHSVINLNRSDRGNRSYILSEMGSFFYNVLLPRIKKLAFSDDWKNGAPQNKNGLTHCFQYLKLEQYEDSLNNIAFSEEAPQELPFAQKIKYLLTKGATESVSLANLEQFNQPFDYEMKIVNQNERAPQNIDLLATFNFLLGLHVKNILTYQHQDRTYRIVKGIYEQQGYLIIWRNFDKNLDLEKELDWVQKQDWFEDDYILYCNADNAFGANGIEGEFKRLMFEDVK